MARVFTTDGAVSAAGGHLSGSMVALGGAGSIGLFIKKTTADVEGAGVFHYLFDNSLTGRTLCYKNPDGGLTWWVNGTSVFDDTVASKSIVTGTGWQHILFTWDNSLGSNKNVVYRNGSTVVTTNVTVTTPGGSATIWVACRDDSISYHWPGSMAEFVIYNQKLSASEALALAAGVSPFRVRPDALKQYWPLLGDSPEPDYGGTRSSLTLGNNFTAPTIANHVGPISFAGFRSFGQAADTIPPGIFTDSAIISTVTSLTSPSEVSSFVEQTTVNSITTPSGSDIYGSPTTYTDTDTVTSTTSISVTEIYETVDSSTISGTTTVSGVDIQVTNVDLATLSTRTTVIAVDDVTLHPSGFWGPYDTDNGII